VAVAVLVATTAATRAGAEALLLDGIAAQVGDEIILESELLERLAVARVQYAIADSNLTAAREELLQRMIDEKVIVQEARKQGITAGEEEVERTVDQYVDTIQQQLGSEQALERELAREGISHDDMLERYRAQARQEILYSRLVQRQIYSKIDITDDEVEQYYREHRDELPEKEAQVRLSHVFIGVRPSDAAITAAQDKLDRVQSRLAAGESFEDVALELSDDPGTRQHGGDLGWFRRGQLDGAFEEAAFSTPVGEVSEPFQTPVGVELVKVTDRDEERDRVRAEHILIMLSTTREDVVQARERAERVLQLARSGVDMASLAREYSDDPESAERGGDIGVFQLPDLVPFVAEAIQGLGVGEVSNVVESEQGLHIFKVTERQEGGEYTLPEIREQLRNRIGEERASELTDAWLADLRREYFIRRTDAQLPWQRPASIHAPVGGQPRPRGTPTERQPSPDRSNGSDEPAGPGAPDEPDGERR
jgi:peptidyl-prolyl cis-trans isomerase SurA